MNSLLMFNGEVGMAAEALISKWIYYFLQTQNGNKEDEQSYSEPAKSERENEEELLIIHTSSNHKLSDEVHSFPKFEKRDLENDNKNHHSSTSSSHKHMKSSKSHKKDRKKDEKENKSSPSSIHSQDSGHSSSTSSKDHHKKSSKRKVDSSEEVRPSKIFKLDEVDSSMGISFKDAKKQEIYGTKHKMMSTPAARVTSLSSITPNAAKAGDTRLRVAAGVRDNAHACKFFFGI